MLWVIILKKFRIEDLEPIDILIDVNCKLVKLIEEEYAFEADSIEEVQYKQVLGLLMYAMIETRPDIAFLIYVVSQHMRKLGSKH